VSVLYAVTDDPRVQAAIIDAGEVAVRAALGWIERDVLHVRRGTGDEAFLNALAARDPAAAAEARIRVLSASGAVAAMFRHRTSRAGDPLLHWHTRVANMAEDFGPLLSTTCPPPKPGFEGTRRTQYRYGPDQPANSPSAGPISTSFSRPRPPTNTAESTI
jgi:hypothetical protein